jgi:quercetin dioxygenase-like cupin family protein
MTSTRPKAVPTVLIDNECVITTRWDFAPGAETGWHRHGHDYVVLPVTDGALKLEEPGGTERVVPLTKGVPYYRGEGVEHNVINAASHDVAFIEVEIRKG